jgi:DNA-binding response OmpR family regulator
MRLLIVGREWRPRTLIRAELQAAGYDVFAVGSWDEAELLLLKRAIHPEGVVFDLEGEDNPPAALRTLLRFVPPGQVVVLTQSAAMPVDDVRALGPVTVLARPFSVGDVVAAVGRMQDRRGRDGPGGDET